MPCQCHRLSPCRGDVVTRALYFVVGDFTHLVDHVDLIKGGVKCTLSLCLCLRLARTLAAERGKEEGEGRGGQKERGGGVGLTIVIGEGQSSRNQDTPVGKVGEHHLKLLAVCLGPEAALPRPRTTLYGRLPWILREEPGKSKNRENHRKKKHQKPQKTTHQKNRKKTWF